MRIVKRLRKKLSTHITVHGGRERKSGAEVCIIPVSEEGGRRTQARRLYTLLCCVFHALPTKEKL